MATLQQRKNTNEYPGLEKLKNKITKHQVRKKRIFKEFLTNAIEKSNQDKLTQGTEQTHKKQQLKYLKSKIAVNNSFINNHSTFINENIPFDRGQLRFLHEGVTASIDKVNRTSAYKCRKDYRQASDDIIGAINFIRNENSYNSESAINNINVREYIILEITIILYTKIKLLPINLFQAHKKEVETRFNNKKRGLPKRK
jgi:hypothetical protein